MYSTIRPIRAMASGFVGCVAILAFLYTMPLFGAPRLNVFVLLSTLSPHYTWWAEPVEYFALGTLVFPILYSVMLYENLPGARPWQRGLTWGIILWALRGLVVAPIMGEGFFSFHTSNPFAAFVEVLIAHAIYGLLLGSLSGGPQRARPALDRQLQRERQAAGRK
ncbi:MAG TPA: DUF6789 family protein [Candidatus Obscuribacterales bacterium]